MILIYLKSILHNIKANIRKLFIFDITIDQLSEWLENETLQTLKIDQDWVNSNKTTSASKYLIKYGSELISLDWFREKTGFWEKERQTQNKLLHEISINYQAHLEMEFRFGNPSKKWGVIRCILLFFLSINDLSRQLQKGMTIVCKSYVYFFWISLFSFLSLDRFVWTTPKRYYIVNCQALSFSLSIFLSISLYLWEIAIELTL